MSSLGFFLSYTVFILYPWKKKLVMMTWPAVRLSRKVHWISRGFLLKDFLTVKNWNTRFGYTLRPILMEIFKALQLKMTLLPNIGILWRLKNKNWCMPNTCTWKCFISCSFYFSSHATAFLGWYLAWNNAQPVYNFSLKNNIW